jgi:hypothetical protein
MTTEEKTPAQLQASAERRLKSLKKRVNAALLELDDPNSERVKNIIAHAKLAKFVAFETQRAAIVAALPEAGRKIMDLSSPEFLIGKTEVQMRMICGLPATDGKPTVSLGVPGADPAENAASEDADKPSPEQRRGRPRT